MLYVLPADPATPKSSLKTLRQTARRAGYLIAADYTTDTFTLVDARLCLASTMSDCPRSRTRSKRCERRDTPPSRSTTEFLREQDLPSDSLSGQLRTDQSDQRSKCDE
jgi:hypothetical protein